jgi:hypothetical protein
MIEYAPPRMPGNVAMHHRPRGLFSPKCIGSTTAAPIILIGGYAKMAVQYPFVFATKNF